MRVGVRALLCRWQGCTHMIWAHLWGNALTCTNGAGLMCNMIKASTEAFMHVFEESWALYFHAWRCSSEAGTTLKTDAQDRSSPVQHTGVQEKPQGHLGRNRARQVRLVELLRIPEIEINTNLTLTWKKRGGLKKKTHTQKKHHINLMTYVLIHSLLILPEVAVMNRCTSQTLIITISVGVWGLCKSDLLHWHAVGWLLPSPVASH